MNATKSWSLPLQPKHPSKVKPKTSKNTVKNISELIRSLLFLLNKCHLSNQSLCALDFHF